MVPRQRTYDVKLWLVHTKPGMGVVEGIRLISLIVFVVIYEKSFCRRNSKYYHDWIALYMVKYLQGVFDT